MGERKRNNNGVRHIQGVGAQRPLARLGGEGGGVVRSLGELLAVELDGGTLIINIAEDNTVTMTGPARISFEGEVNI